MDLKTLKSSIMEASDAHHIYEQDELGGDFDQEWPTWYAQYLLEHGLKGKTDLIVEELAMLLEHAEEDRLNEDESMPWQDYYAEYLIDEL